MISTFTETDLDVLEWVGLRLGIPGQDLQPAVGTPIMKALVRWLEASCTTTTASSPRVAGAQ